MSKLLNKISQLLESPDSLVTGDEYSLLDEDLRGQLESQGLLIKTSPALSVVCDECESGHVEEYIRQLAPNGTAIYRIACPDAGWVEVPKLRLQQWTLNTSNLASLLAATINADAQPHTLLSCTAWRIGSIEIGGATYVLVLSQKHAAATAVEMLKQPSRTVLITPFRMTDSTNEVAAAVTLEEAFNVTGETFCLDIERIRSELGVDLPSRNEFRKRGEMWVSTFEGNTVYLQDSVGMAYIARLLAEPNRNLPAVALLAARAGIDERVTEGSSGELLDEEARKNYETRYLELVSDLEKAESDIDPNAAEKIQNEMDQLSKELARATGLGGRSRSSTDAEKVRKSVSMAVTRAIEKVASSDSSLGNHLSVSISSGKIFCYSPVTPTDWLT